jgi:hypothetical protein
MDIDETDCTRASRGHDLPGGYSVLARPPSYESIWTDMVHSVSFVRSNVGRLLACAPVWHPEACPWRPESEEEEDTTYIHLRSEIIPTSAEELVVAVADPVAAAASTLPSSTMSPLSDHEFCCVPQQLHLNDSAIGWAYLLNPSCL